MTKLVKLGRLVEHRPSVHVGSRVTAYADNYKLVRLVNMIEYAGQKARHAERGLALAEQIMTRALRGGLGPDGRLPTERQLAADLGETRSAIRYALGILEA